MKEQFEYFEFYNQKQERKEFWNKENITAFLSGVILTVALVSFFQLATPRKEPEYLKLHPKQMALIRNHMRRLQTVTGHTHTPVDDSFLTRARNWGSNAWDKTTDFTSNAWDRTTDWVGDRYDDTTGYFAFSKILGLTFIGLLSL